MEDGVNVLFMDTIFRYYLHTDPQGFTDEEWAKSLYYIKHIKELENGE